MTKLLVAKAWEHYKEQVNAKRTEVENEVGQKALLNANNFT